LPDTNEVVSNPLEEKAPSPSLPEVKEDAEPEEKPDGRIATKQLFSDDEEDDEDDIHIPAAVDTAPVTSTQTPAATSTSGTGSSSRLFEDDEEDWGADEDPLSFLKK